MTKGKGMDGVERVRPCSIIFHHQQSPDFSGQAWTIMEIHGGVLVRLDMYTRKMIDNIATGYAQMIADDWFGVGKKDQ